MPGRPKLGQHFLADELLLERIAGEAVVPGDAVIEIGPGRGALTRHLVRKARIVVAVEVDRSLASALPRNCGSPPNLRVIAADILRVNLSDLVAQHALDQCIVTGNLPYYITSPVLRGVFAARPAVRSATFLMQEEVADRAVARPGRRPFGYLSCLCQLHSEPEKVLKVPPEAFSPPPKVRSAVVRFRMREAAPPEGLLDFLAACFRSPRKTLRNNLAGRYPGDAVAADPCAGLRAQQLGIEELRALWARLEGRR